MIILVMMVVTLGVSDIVRYIPNWGPLKPIVHFINFCYALSETIILYPFMIFIPYSIIVWFVGAVEGSYKH